VIDWMMRKMIKDKEESEREEGQRGEIPRRYFRTIVNGANRLLWGNRVSEHFKTGAFLLEKVKEQKRVQKERVKRGKNTLEEEILAHKWQLFARRVSW